MNENDKVNGKPLFSGIPPLGFTMRIRKMNKDCFKGKPTPNRSVHLLSWAKAPHAELVICLPGAVPPKRSQPNGGTRPCTLKNRNIIRLVIEFLVKIPTGATSQKSDHPAL